MFMIVIKVSDFCAMCSCVLLSRNFVSRIHVGSATYIRAACALECFLQTKRTYSLLLKAYAYSVFDSDLRYSNRYLWIVHATTRFNRSSANAADHSSVTASDKLKLLKKKKEGRRTERLERQRLNELKKKVCICLMWWFEFNGFLPFVYCCSLGKCWQISEAAEFIGPSLHGVWERENYHTFSVDYRPGAKSDDYDFLVIMMNGDVYVDIIFEYFSKILTDE